MSLPSLNKVIIIIIIIIIMKLEIRSYTPVFPQKWYPIPEQNGKGL